MHALLTGAEQSDVPQRDHDLSLGGYASSERVNPLTARRVNAIRGIRILHVCGLNGVGVASLTASGASALRWTPPGGEPGAAVTIADGETKAIYGTGGDADKYAIVMRTSADELRGIESVQLTRTLNNTIGGSNFTGDESAAGHEKYRAIGFRNAGSAQVTNLKVWIDSAYDTNLRIASEAFAADQIQTIADEDTAPTGRTWVAPTTEGAALNLGTLNAGAKVGLWIERSVDTGAAAEAGVETVIRYKFTVSGSDHYGELSGASHVAENGIEGWVAWWGENADPDTTAEPDEFSATLPVQLAQVLTAGSIWYLRVARRNQYGLISDVEDAKVFNIAGDASENPAAPEGPHIVTVTPYGNGGAVIEAVYFPGRETSTANRADAWLIYFTDDGTDPDPAVDTPIEVAMIPHNGPRRLTYTISTEYPEDTPIRVIVRTRRSGTPDADSLNTAITQVLANPCGPVRPTGIAMQKNTWGIQQGPQTPPDSIVYIDQPNNVYLEVKQGSLKLYGGATLGFAILYNSLDPAYNAVYSDFAHEATDITAAGSANAFDVISWTGSDKRVGINVNGTRKAVIDFTNQVMYCAYSDTSAEASGSCQQTPVVQKYAHTVFKVWDPDTEGYVAVLSLNSSGGMEGTLPFFIPTADMP